MSAATDGDLRLRAPEPGDERALAEIVAEPEVRRWWPSPDYALERGWILDVGGAVAGWLEHHEETNPWFLNVAFDIFLTSKLHGHGYGRRGLQLGIDHFAARGHHRFTVDPNAANERAIRCYAALGFVTVGVMRAYERDASGVWTGALLMELVLGEAGSEARPGSEAR